MKSTNAKQCPKCGGQVRQMREGYRGIFFAGCADCPQLFEKWKFNALPLWGKGEKEVQP